MSKTQASQELGAFGFCSNCRVILVCLVLLSVKKGDRWQVIRSDLKTIFILGFEVKKGDRLRVQPRGVRVAG